MKFFRHKAPKIGLALGTGTARGLAHIGVLKALKEAAIPVDMVAGTSMGAMIGACFAKEGDIAAVEEIALKADWRQLTRFLDLNLGSLRKGLIRGQRIQELLCSLIGDAKFRDLKIPFAAVATDVNTGEEVVIKKGSVIEAVRASISLPAIFIPVRLEGKLLVDGGLTNPMPTDVLRDIGAEFIIAVNVIAEPQKRKPIGLFKKGGTPETPTIFDTLVQSFYILEYEIIRLKMLQADIVISPDVSHIQAFEFYKGEEIILAGYEAARNALPKLQRLIRDR